MGFLEVFSFVLLVLLIRQLFKLGGLISKVGIGVFLFLYLVSLVDGSYTGNDFMVLLLFLTLVVVLHRYLKTLKQESDSQSHLNRKKLGTYEFSYKDNQGNVSRRLVDVYRIHYSKRDNTGFFTGYCHDQKMERTFRMDRVFGDVIDRDTGEILSLE